MASIKGDVHQGRGPRHALRERVRAPELCSHCGSSLYDDLGGKYFVAAGLVRDLDMDPSFHLQVAYKASWHQIGDGAPQYAENPPG